MNIHYSTTTGEIKSWGTAEYTHGAKSYIDDCMIIVLPERDIHPDTHKIDLKSSAVIEKTADEKHQAALPTGAQVANAIAAELSATDGFMVPTSNPRVGSSNLSERATSIKNLLPASMGKRAVLLFQSQASSCFSISWTGILTRSLCSSPCSALRTAAE